MSTPTKSKISRYARTRKIDPIVPVAANTAANHYAYTSYKNQKSKQYRVPNTKAHVRAISASLKTFELQKSLNERRENLDQNLSKTIQDNNYAAQVNLPTSANKQLELKPTTTSNTTSRTIHNAKKVSEKKQISVKAQPIKESNEKFKRNWFIRNLWLFVSIVIVVVGLYLLFGPYSYVLSDFLAGK